MSGYPVQVERYRSSLGACALRGIIAPASEKRWTNTRWQASHSLSLTVANYKVQVESSLPDRKTSSVPISSWVMWWALENRPSSVLGVRRGLLLEASLLGHWETCCSCSLLHGHCCCCAPRVPHGRAEKSKKHQQRGQISPENQLPLLWELDL